MNASPTGIGSECPNCRAPLQLQPWQLNALVIDEPFACQQCQAALRLEGTEQLRRLRRLGTLSLIHAAALVLAVATLLIGVVVEKMGLISQGGQWAISLGALLGYGGVWMHAWRERHQVVRLQAVRR